MLSLAHALAPSEHFLSKNGAFSLEKDRRDAFTAL